MTVALAVMPKRLVNALRASEAELPRLERDAWNEYARERWSTAAGERAARRAFERKVMLAKMAMSAQGERCRRPVQFTLERLRYLAVQSLAVQCPYCVVMFGVGTFGIVWDVPPRVDNDALTWLRNVVVCCQLCAKAKGSLSGRKWLDVLMELRAGDPIEVRSWLDAQVAGRKVMDKREGQKVLPRAAAAKVTRE